MNHQDTPWWQGTRGEWWVAVQLALLAAIVLVPRVGPPGGPAWMRPLGWAGIAGGLTLIVLGRRTLGASATIWPRPPADAILVQEGIYRVVRHPIYSGLICDGIGVALWRASLLHLALTALLAVVLDAKARREERWLTERFPDYALYRATVRKFIPGIY